MGPTSKLSAAQPCCGWPAPLTLSPVSPCQAMGPTYRTPAVLPPTPSPFPHSGHGTHLQDTSGAASLHSSSYSGVSVVSFNADRSRISEVSVFRCVRVGEVKKGVDLVSEEVHTQPRELGMNTTCSAQCVRRQPTAEEKAALLRVQDSSPFEIKLARLHCEPLVEAHPASSGGSGDEGGAKHHHGGASSSSGSSQGGSSRRLSTAETA